MSIEMTGSVCPQATNTHFDFFLAFCSILASLILAEVIQYLFFVITTSLLTFRTSAETLLSWACCPVSRLGKMPVVGLHCFPCVQGKRCNVVKTTSLLCLVLNGSLLRSLMSAVLQPSLTSLRSDFIDEWPFPLLSIPFADPLAKAELCNAPSPSSLFGLSSWISSFSAPSHSSSFSCSSETSGLSRRWRSLWWTCPESCQEEAYWLYRMLLLWQSKRSENYSEHYG